MEKKYYTINIPGKHGYSFMVCGNFEEDEAVEKALSAGLFEGQEDDAEYAIVDGLVSQNDIDQFKNWGCCHEI